jgi:O-antigen ligase
VQRAVSFVPLANVDEMAQDDANRSTSWRLQIWAMAWEEVPRYMVIGKGFSFAGEFLAEMVAYQHMSENTEIAFQTHNYHSGPLVLLIDLGVPGFLLCTAFFFVSCREHASAVKRFNHSRLDHLYYKYMTIVYVWQVASFYLIYGDMSGVFVRILVNGAMLRILRYSLDEQLADEKRRDEEDDGPDRAAQATKAGPQVRAATLIGA